MADTSVAITAGSGTAIDTRTEATNGNHRQVVVIGDGSVNAGIAPVDVTKGLAVDLTASGALATVSTVTAVTAITNALPAGTNAIGKLAANSGVIIGDVNIVSNIPGVAATSLGKAEDAAHTSGDTGVMIFAVRNDAGGALATTTGDYIPLTTDSAGALRVVGSSGTTQYAEDASHASGDSTVFVSALRRDTVPVSSSGTAGDYSAINTDANGRLYTNASIYTPLGDSAMDDTNDCVKVSIVADSVGSSVDTEDGTVATGQSSVALVISQGYEYDGTNWTRPRGQGTVAHDGVDAGNPLKIGAHAKSALSGITLVSTDDRTDLYADLDGGLLVRSANLGDVVQERATNTDGASTAFASGLAAPGAGVRLWVKQATICNSSATFCTVDLRDGSAGSILWTLPVPATGGVVQNFDPPLKLTANTALAYDASAATSTLTISANGFKSKV